MPRPKFLRLRFITVLFSGAEHMRGLIQDRDGVYHYRRRIPDDVRRALRELDASSAQDGPRRDKREEKKRLGRDKVKAEAAWAEHDRAVEVKWAALRSGRPSGLSSLHIQALAGEIHKRWLELYPPRNEDTASGANYTLQIMQEIDSEVPREFTSPGFDYDRLEFLHGDHVDAILEARGLIVDAGIRWRLIQAAQQAAKHACRVAIKRCNGDLREDRDEPIYPAWPDSETTTLSGLCASWIRTQAEAKRDSHASFKSCIDKFIAFLGHDEVARVSATELRRWIKHLKEPRAKKPEGLSDVRIRDGYFAAIKTVFNSARKGGLIDVNPCDTVHPPGQPLPRKREKDLRSGEVYAILKASLEPQPEVGEDVANTRRWVPWVLAYTGARVSEITRLEAKHIIPEAGVWAIDIQQSKNGRPRLVPIHRDLIQQGFLDFVRRREGMPLFFAPKKLKDDHLVIHKTRSEGLAEWARKVAGIEKRSVAPNHGFRHRFKTECRRIAMDREVRHYIQGHAFKIAGEDYGFFPVDITAAWMELFPTYDVSGTELNVQRAAGNDVIARAVALLHQERSSKEAQARVA
ncbi:MAG: site-specific integrase [Xanthobacteraceae bacterium]|nr:site-specific integrase [Xanthobacteraceae bacterium]